MSFFFFLWRIESSGLSGGEGDRVAYVRAHVRTLQECWDVVRSEACNLHGMVVLQCKSISNTNNRGCGEKEVRGKDESKRKRQVKRKGRNKNSFSLDNPVY